MKNAAGTKATNPSSFMMTARIFTRTTSHYRFHIAVFAQFLFVEISGSLQLILSQFFTTFITPRHCLALLFLSFLFFLPYTAPSCLYNGFFCDFLEVRQSEDIVVAILLPVDLVLKILV